MTADYPTAASPTVHRTAWIAPTADVTGDVTLGPDSSVWFQCVLRGDIAPIHVGAESNVQDLTMVHVDIDRPCHIGDRVGRKPALMLSVVLMGASTTAIGVLPDHAMLGTAAAVLLLRDQPFDQRASPLGRAQVVEVRIGPD